MTSVRMRICRTYHTGIHVSFQHGHILQQRRSQWVEHNYWCYGCNLKITRRSSWIHNQGTHCERTKGLSTIDFQWGLWCLSWMFDDSTNCGYVEWGDGTICICAIHGKTSLLEACKNWTEHTRTWGSRSTYSRNHMWQEHTTNQKAIRNVRLWY